MSNNILFWYKCEDLQCIDLFGINQNVAQKYSPNCAIQFSKFKNLPASEGGGQLLRGAHPPSDTPLCAQARNWRWRATRSSPPQCSKRIYAPECDVGLANWHLPLKRGACERKISKFEGLWAENFQIWGLVSWKFPNLGACELKFGWKSRLLRLKFPNFLKRGSCELTLLLEMGPLWAAGEAWKGGLQGRTSPYSLSRSVPPPPPPPGSFDEMRHALASVATFKVLLFFFVFFFFFCVSTIASSGLWRYIRGLSFSSE